MRGLFAVVLLAGCASAVAEQPIANHASRGPRLECTDALVDRFAAALRTRWRTTALELRCVPGHFGVDGFFLEARNGELHRTGVVDASGAELVAFVDEPTESAATFLNGYAAADLDGDGDDEIIESWRRIAYEKLDADNWLVVRRIANGRFSTRIQGPYVSRYHPELGGCSATWELRRGTLLVAVDVHPGIPPTDCLPTGLHRFALRGHLLVER